MRVQYISDLLYNHECVIVPGLGGFISSYRPARISGETNTFSPPSCNIAFNASLSANDGLLASFISKKTGISYREALEEIQKWVDESLKLLNSGARFELENIGFLELNADRNLQFEPDIRLNFLGDSFGLPSFVVCPLIRGEADIREKHERVQSWPSKLKYLVPATLKWAAVLAPFIAFTIWGSLNSATIGNYVQNYSGLFSWVRTTPGKTAVLAPGRNNSAKTIQNFQSPESSPAGIMKELQIEYAPGVVSYEAMMNNGLIQPQEDNTATLADHTLTAQYFIIGGAFREHSNALKMLNELKAQGFPAAIIDTTGSGLFVVSMRGFSVKTEAVAQLRAVKEAGYEGAWIMQKIN